MRTAAKLLVLASILCAAEAHAYIGPGAGIAILTSAGALLVGLLVGFLAILFWPVRWVYRRITRKRPPNAPQIDRAVIVGLDGLDPELTRRFMAAGKLPNMEKIAARGGLQDLETTCPAMSPVAWSSFATGVSPSKHGIYDFLTRDPRSYLPDLSSTEIHPPARALAFGRFRIPIGKPVIKLLRKSTPFWKILGAHQIPCSILRVPITFPPDHFEGTMLSAMCVPDLQGSQGTFTYFTAETGEEAIGGERVRVTPGADGRISAALLGPQNPIRIDGRRLEQPFTVERGRAGVELVLGRERVPLVEGRFTDWIEVAFPMGLGLQLRGICRFRLLSTAPFRLYVTPINIDPGRPIMPISQPAIFSIFLAKLIGRYATLGLAEDTWALNEGVLDEAAFLEQAWANQEEREAMFFEMLERTPRGVITCVFDATDRIQHMFMRFLDDGHPARGGNEAAAKYRDVIEQTYMRMDAMLGRVLERVALDDPRTLVLVLSDHGFKTFRRGVNLNSWLLQHGYMKLKPGHRSSGEWFEGVDWKRTRAFGLGLAGVFLNLKGRERDGCVEPGADAKALADELAAKLTGLVDEGTGEVCVNKAYAAHRMKRGPYADRSPDLIVGYSAGWRASWDSVRGIADGVVFSDNTKAWSGDHCIDPALVPGVLLANRRLGGEGRRAAIVDLAPTLLQLFGVPPPRFMDGESLV